MHQLGYSRSSPGIASPPNYVHKTVGSFVPAFEATRVIFVSLPQQRSKDRTEHPYLKGTGQRIVTFMFYVRVVVPGVTYTSWRLILTNQNPLLCLLARTRQGRLECTNVHRDLQNRAFCNLSRPLDKRVFHNLSPKRLVSLLVANLFSIRTAFRPLSV